MRNKIWILMFCFILLLGSVGCAASSQSSSSESEITFSQVSDKKNEESIPSASAETPKEEVIDSAVKVEVPAEECAAVDAPIEEVPVVEEVIIQEQFPSYQPPASGLTPQSGVNYYGGRTETYYSSRVLYHYRTGEWILDSEGFYHTPEGYYVVAASDMPQGTIFETSKGTAQVLDCGCSAGVTDFYVNW